MPSLQIATHRPASGGLPDLGEFAPGHARPAWSATARQVGALIALISLLVPAVSADTFTVVLQGTNGNRVPRIIGASGSIDSAQGFSGFDYFECLAVVIPFLVDNSVDILNLADHLIGEASASQTY